MREQDFREILEQLPGTPLEGTTYRVIPARFYLTALSTIGSRQRGGRYNPRDRLEALYLAEHPVVALQEVEALQRTSHELIGVTFSPKTLLSVQYSLTRVLDLTQAEVQEALETSTDELARPWILLQSTEGSAPTQRLGLAAFEAGFEALRVPSAKAPQAANLIIFPDGLHPASTLRVYDDSGFIDASLP